nr:hypothetical protein [Segnochrobactrum spirostomi]
MQSEEGGLAAIEHVERSCRPRVDFEEPPVAVRAEDEIDAEQAAQATRRDDRVGRPGDFGLDARRDGNRPGDSAEPERRVRRRVGMLGADRENPGAVRGAERAGRHHAAGDPALEIDRARRDGVVGGGERDGGRVERHGRRASVLGCALVYGALACWNIAAAVPFAPLGEKVPRRRG